MSSESIRVLHVDDEPDFADLAATYVEREDERFDVETATSASDGLDRLAESEFDCVVSDHDMPQMDGVEFLERVRDEHLDLPFILFTGKGSEEVASDAIRAGVTDYLQKGRDASQYELLANRITNAVESYRTERRVQRQQRQHRELFDNAPVMYVATRDVDGQLVVEDCNERLLERLGYDREEVIDRPISEFYTEESRRTMHEEGGYEQALHREFGIQERTLVAKDGERVHVLNRANPRLDSQGTPVGVQAMYLDVTERRKRARRLELAIEQTRSGVWEYDVESGMITRHEGASGLWAENTHTTVPIEEAIAERVHPEDRQAVWNAIDATVEDGEPYRVEFRHATPDGYRWVEARGELVRETDADPGRLIALTTDIHAHKDREAQLHEERDRLGALFEDAPRPILESEIDGDEHRIVDVNDAFTEVFGYERAEIVGQPVPDTLVPEDDLPAHEQFRERVAAGEALGAEVERTTVDGERTFLLDVVPYGTESPPADGAFAIYTDITERKERERELELYETMLETVPDGVYALDEDLRYIAVNQGMADLTGYSKEELIGSHLSLVNTEDVIDKAKRQRERLKTDGFDATTVVAEHGHLTADGASVPTEVRFRALPPAEDGSFRGTAGIIRDITEQKQRETEFRRYKQIVDTMQETACIYDEEGRFVLVNESLAEFYETTPEALEGERSRILPEISADADGDPYQELLDGTREAFHAEVDVERSDGGTEVMAYHLTPLVVDGTIEGAVGVAHEVTDQRQRERELERQNERLEQFASVVSHDLRNPLNVADGNVELAREECDSEHLDTVARALDRMDTLVADLLTLAREGTEVESTEPTDLAAVVDACWKNVDTADATLVVDTDQTISADRSRFAQLLENLVRNAVEHGGSDVTVTVGDLDDGTGFYVADDGPGIPADERDDVFEYGYSTTEDGTGLGLAIVEEIAEAHRWRVGVTDSTSGGTRFDISGIETAT